MTAIQIWGIAYKGKGMFFYWNNWICSQLLNKNDNFAKKIAWKYLGFILDQMSLGVMCHPEEGFRPLLFSHSWTTHGPESTCWSGNCHCFTEIWPKMYMTFMQFWSDFEKSSVLHTFARWVVKCWAISIYLISIQSYWHRRLHGCPILCIKSLTNAPASFQLVL